MTVKQITSDTADEKIKQLYETAFPEDEQIPWKDWMRLIEEMPLDFTAYYDGEDFIGFTIVYPRKSINWFWYFAVCEEFRVSSFSKSSGAVVGLMPIQCLGDSLYGLPIHSYCAFSSSIRSGWHLSEITEKSLQSKKENMCPDT